jgi:hypothetical protein
LLEIKPVAGMPAWQMTGFPKKARYRSSVTGFLLDSREQERYGNDLGTTCER